MSPEQIRPRQRIDLASVQPKDLVTGSALRELKDPKRLQWGLIGCERRKGDRQQKAKGDGWNRGALRGQRRLAYPPVHLF